MAIRKIVKIGDELLRKVAKPVRNFDAGLETLLDDMWQTMNANKGMGLAGPQVGVSKRIVIMNVNNIKLELINPEIISSSGKDIEEEGCLSCGTTRGLVSRPYFVTVKAKDRYGYEYTISGEKYLARCICHEIDHLDGVLFIDKLYKKEE